MRQAPAVRSTWVSDAELTPGGPSARPFAELMSVPQIVGAKYSLPTIHGIPETVRAQAITVKVPIFTGEEKSHDSWDRHKRLLLYDDPDGVAPDKLSRNDAAVWHNIAGWAE